MLNSNFYTECVLLCYSHYAVGSGDNPVWCNEGSTAVVQVRVRTERGTRVQRHNPRVFPALEKKTFQSLGVLSSVENAKKIFFLLWNPLRRQFCAPPPNHICMLSLTMSNDVDDVDDRELDFKSIKRQKAESNTHTHTHTHRRMKQLWSLRLAPVVFLYVHLLLF